MAGADPRTAPGDAPRRLVLVAILALGLSCVMTQLALLREMLCVFAGNELVLGVALGNWLLLMGLGAALGRWAHRLKEPSGVLAALLIFTAVAPLGQVFALRGLRHSFFLRGAEIGVIPTVIASFVVLLPYCLAAGFMLTLACWLLAQRGDERGPGRVYVADSLGSIAGGALFSFVLVHWLDHFALLCVPALVNLVLAAWLVWQTRSPRAAGIPAAETGQQNAGSTWLLGPAALLFVGLSALVLFTNPDATSTALQFPGQQVLFSGHSPYGRLVVTETGGQINFLENGVAVASAPNIELAEETAHYAMVQRPGARRVLLISGTLSGAAREILRYRIGELHCVEIDPQVVTAGRRFLPQEFKDPRLRLFAGDARRFVRRTGAKYDVVIVALPDPSTAQLNRFFTTEFFGDAKRILAPGGVVAFAVGRYENYVSRELGGVLSCARGTAGGSFRNVVLIPGGRVYFLASDGPLHTDIAARLEQLGLKTKLVNRNYLAAMLAPDRLADVHRGATQPAPVNRDFTPALYLLHLRHWASQFRVGFGPFQVVLAIAFAAYLARLRGPALTLFASGFAGSALEIVLLLGVQILAGSLYQQVGLVVTLFMAGLAAGAFTMDRRGRRASRRTLAGLALAIAALAAALPWVLRGLSLLSRATAGDVLLPALIGLITFALAALAGAQFPLANRLELGAAGPVVSRLYTADFVGACLGALLASTLFIPLLGVTAVCLLTAALNAGAGAALSWRRTGG
jgi:spermidine synthase